MKCAIPLPGRSGACPVWLVFPVASPPRVSRRDLPLRRRKTAPSRATREKIPDRNAPDSLSVQYKETRTGRCRRRDAGRPLPSCCLLYTSDAADDLLCVDLGGRRIIKKKN